MSQGPRLGVMEREPQSQRGEKPGDWASRRGVVSGSHMLKAPGQERNQTSDQLADGTVAAAEAPVQGSHSWVPTGPVRGPESCSPEAVC